MNQILSVEMKKEKKRSRSSGPLEIKTIIKFFCIILIIFGIIIAGKSAYTIFLENNLITENKDIAEISTTKQGNQLVISIKHSVEITKITYNWNEKENNIIPGDGTSTLESTIDLPSGNNTLNLTVTDIKGNEQTYTKEFVPDPDEPQISLELIGTNIKITAKDNEKLSLITYRWDDQDEKEIEIPEDSSAQIEKEIEIPMGQHTLTVVVVNSKNKQITKTQEVKGVTKPKIDISRDEEDKSYVIITAVDEISLMKEVKFVINGKKWKVVDTIEEGTKIQFKYQVEEGENLIKVTAVNNDGVEDTKQVRYKYPNEE